MENFSTNNTNWSNNKPVSTDLIKHTLNKLEVDRLKLKEVLILLPLNRENLTSYLSPILGQYGIRNADFLNTFVESFNKETNGIFAGQISAESGETGLSDDLELTIPVTLKTYKGGKYTLSIGYPHTGFLFSRFFSRKRRFIKNNKPYRNYSKLMKLAAIRSFALGLSPSLLGYETSLLNSYVNTRNSLHKKR